MNIPLPPSLRLPAITALAVLLGFSFSFLLPGETVPTVSVAAERLNVFYVDVLNPVTVAVAGVPAGKVTLSSREVEVISKGNGRYVILAEKPGTARMTVTSPRDTVEKVFRVRRLPEPVTTLEGRHGKLSDGAMPVDTVRSVQGLSLDLPLDFEVDCRILSYEVIRASRQQVPEVIMWETDDTLRQQKLREFLAQAQSGDIYYFTNVLARCPNEPRGSKVNPLIITVE